MDGIDMPDGGACPPGPDGLHDICGYHSLAPDGTLLQMNATELGWLGYRPGEIIGRMRFEQLLAAHSRALFHASFARLKEDGRVEDLEYDLVRRDGSLLPVLVNAKAIRDRHGRFLASSSVVLDNRERKQRKAEIAALQLGLERRADAAETATRAKSAFLANMSHEIRTPMNAVIGFTRMAQRSATQAQQKDQLSKALEAAEHLLQIINDVLDLSKIEANKIEIEQDPFVLRHLLDRLLALLGQRAEAKGLALAAEIDPAVPRELRGDPLRLGQVLMNYIGNALKFTASGSVVVRVRMLAEEAETLLLRFEVQDSGIGIAPEDQERLFLAFEQADNSIARKYGGTGLGLAISRRLAALMGGETGLGSRPGEGSTFWFTARLGKHAAGGCPASGSVAASAAEERLRQQFRHCRVLLVEDQELNREVALDLLHEAGLAVATAPDGAAAVRLARATAYDLILMDVQMPVMDGIEATQAIRRLAGRQATPIIAMTADAFSEDRRRCLEAGMSDHLGKPIEPERLYACLLRWLERPGEPGGDWPGGNAAIFQLDEAEGRQSA